MTLAILILIADNLQQTWIPFPNFPNEEWVTASKLRNSANDSLYYTSQAVGSIALEASKYDLNNARKNLFTLQSMYTFASKQKFLDLEPELIVSIDEILAEIDKRITKSDEEAKKTINKTSRHSLCGMIILMIESAMSS